MLIEVIDGLLTVIIPITFGVSAVYIASKSIDLICFFCEWSNTKKYNRIKFSAFISFYNINSKNWILFDNYVGYKIIETEKIYGRSYTNSKTNEFGFSLFDFLKYRRWKSQSEINKKKKKHLEEYQEVLNYIKQDIEKVNRENEQMIKKEAEKITANAENFNVRLKMSENAICKKTLSPCVKCNSNYFCEHKLIVCDVEHIK